MARVTTEDCIDKEPNRFNLVMLASLRAREISSGYPATVERDNDKPTVIALREIAEETQKIDNLYERTIVDNQKQIDINLKDDMQFLRDIAYDGTDTGSIQSTIDLPDDNLTEEQLHRMMKESGSD